MALAQPKGALPVLQYCTPAQLQVDLSYQRELDRRGHQLVSRIARSWDWGLCQPLVVAQRSDRSLWVVDGQHRLLAARERGDIAQLPCVIFQPRDPADEAATFVKLNGQRRPLTAYALWNASVSSGDTHAVALSSILSGLGMSFSGAADPKRLRPGQLNAVGTIRAWHVRHGDARTRKALGIIATAFEGQVLAIAGILFRGVASLLLEHGHRFDDGLLVAVLQGSTVDGWMAEFRRRAAADNIGIPAAAVATIANAYAEAVDE